MDNTITADEGNGEINKDSPEYQQGVALGRKMLGPENFEAFGQLRMRLDQLSERPSVSGMEEMAVGCGEGMRQAVREQHAAKARQAAFDKGYAFAYSYRNNGIDAPEVQEGLKENPTDGFSDGVKALFADTAAAAAGQGVPGRLLEFLDRRNGDVVRQLMLGVSGSPSGNEPTQMAR